MAFDGAFLYALREEMLPYLLEARIDKIHQPSRDELLLSLRGRGGARKLYLSARTPSPRLHFTSLPLGNPAAPPMFCMLLRKHLTGGRIAAVRQPGLERLLYLDIDCQNELGDSQRLTLAVELIGRQSNLVLIGPDNRVIDCIRRVDLEMSPVRPMLPGLVYTPPPASGKLDLTVCDPTSLCSAVADSTAAIPEALLTAAQGLSPLLCREIAHLAFPGRTLSGRSLTPAERQTLTDVLDRIQRTIVAGEKRAPYLLREPDGTPAEYSFLPITQYGLDRRGEPLDSFSVLLDTFYANRDAALRRNQHAQDILRVLVSSSERAARKLERQRGELAQAGNREEKRIFADLIIAGASHIPRGADKAALVNYYDENCAPVVVPLDPSLSAAANAQKYYKDYRKAQTAQRVLAQQIAAGEQELQYLDTVLDALSRATTLREMEELREELIEGGYLHRPRGRQKKAEPLGPHRFVSDDGFVLLVGRNNRQNDQLTLRTARGEDVWFHVKNMPGSHVVVQTQGRTPPPRTLEQAAMLAALFSKAARSQQVPVDYTLVRHVKKPAGAKPGMVIYVDQHTAYVTPDPQLLSRLQG